MKNKINSLLAFICLGTVLLVGLQVPAIGQEVQYEKPSWRFGLSGGVNLNYYEGTTQNINASTFAPTQFGHGDGMGLFLAPMIEYHNPNSILGFMLQAGYDSRKGIFDQVLTACNCPADLSTELSYITIEPSLRIAPFRSNFYIYTGPRFAFVRDQSFEYTQSQNPEFPNPTQDINKTGDFSEMNSMLISMQVGAGLDIPLNSSNSKTQFAISPFVTYHPYIGQEPRSIETWDVTTIRAGVTLKMGSGKRVERPVVIAAPVAAPLPTVNFTVNSPNNRVGTVSYVETFPQLNYVFFNPSSPSVIPDRYIKLNSTQVANFSENQVGDFNQVNTSGRSSRQMTVYYNILNILGDRMVKNPGTSVSLVGSNDSGTADAKQMAESVKTYLVNTFGIATTRITTEGRTTPVIPSKQPAGTQSLAELRQEDTRVTIESNSAALLKEYQTGPNPLARSVTRTEDAPAESHVTFNVDGGTKAFKSWKLEVKDESGKIQNFGPYTNDSVSMPGKSILGNREKGTYTVTMIGEAPNGTIVRKEAKTEIVALKPDVVEHGTRYSVVYEFDSATSTAAYEKYLMDVIAPAIPTNSTVKIQGYTDSIGEKDYNLKLSQERAADVRAILQSALTKAGRTDVKFEVVSHGDSSQSQFSNTLPEQRFFNRTVLIDIAPSK